MEIPTEKDVPCNGGNGNDKGRCYQVADESPFPLMLETIVQVVSETQKQEDLQQDVKEEKERKCEYSFRKIH
jgi:hypothetical protein